MESVRPINILGIVSKLNVPKATNRIIGANKWQRLGFSVPDMIDRRVMELGSFVWHCTLPMENECATDQFNCRNRCTGALFLFPFLPSFVALFIVLQFNSVSVVQKTPKWSFCNNNDDDNDIFWQNLGNLWWIDHFESNGLIDKTKRNENGLLYCLLHSDHNVDQHSSCFLLNCTISIVSICFESVWKWV